MTRPFMGPAAAPGGFFWDCLRLPQPPGGSGSAITMVIDKGLPPEAFADLLQVAAPFVQLWKLGFGTAVLYSPEQLARKVARARLAGVEVYPGGTCLELARAGGQADRMLRRFADLGFRWVEVSDGTFDMAPRERKALIRKAMELGFEVVSEVGSKDERRTLEPVRAAEQVAADLESGARYVIVEARDSGRGVGIFDGDGRLRSQLLEELVAHLEAVLPGGRALDAVIWEAPQTEQQRWLLLRFGPAVGLGNVQVSDVLTLAAMRLGLRSDTLRAWAGRHASPPPASGPSCREACGRPTGLPGPGPLAAVMRPDGGERVRGQGAGSRRLPNPSVDGSDGSG